MKKASSRFGIALLALAMGGCAHTAYQVSAGQMGGAAATQVNLSSNSALGVVMIVGLMLADGLHYYRVEPDGSRTPVDYAPDLDPARRINVQDCTQPVNPRAGNLVCR